MRKGIPLLLPLFSLLFFFAGCATNGHDLVYENNSPFYQEEEDDGSYGEKSPLDRVMQLDPGQRNLKYSQSLITDPPRRIAILPFENLEGGDFKLNWVPITGRSNDEKENKSWTYANRLRKFLFAYMSLREFELMSLLETDTILKELGITNSERLYGADPRDLAAAMGVDALIYGKVTHHRAHYYFLFSQVAVGLSVKCVSGKDGSDLFEVSEVRRDNKVRVAIDPIGMVAASVQNIFSVRNLYMVRAADELCREIVSRIPVAESLIKERELYWKELVASNQKIQAIKEKMAIANGDTTDLLTNGGVEVAKADDDIDTAAVIRPGESEDILEGVTEGVQLADADGVVRAAESTTIPATHLNKSILEEAKESGNVGEEMVVAAMATDSFPHIASAPGLAVEEVTEIALADIIYMSRDEDATNFEDEAMEVDASNIVYSNKGVIVDSQTETTGNKDDEGTHDLKDIMNEIIEMSISDIIYSSKDLPLDSPSEAIPQDVTS
ncbi:MAG: GNA1162 family protein [Candidatus Brocadiales bacterium]